MPTPLARRAAVDDLSALRELWALTGLPAEELSSFLTEFQVASTADGRLVAAVGLMVEGSDALLHSEAIVPDLDPEELRATLWRRVMILARNQGIHRVWTQEDDEFWVASGFLPAAIDPNGRVPSFVQPADDWRCCQLFDPAEAKQVVAEQMAVWQATRSGEVDELQGKIRTVRNLAFGFAGLVILVILGMLFYIVRARPDLLQRLVRGGR